MLSPCLLQDPWLPSKVWVYLQRAKYPLGWPSSRQEDVSPRHCSTIWALSILFLLPKEITEAQVTPSAWNYDKL